MNSQQRAYYDAMRKSQETSMRRSHDPQSASQYNNMAASQRASAPSQATYSQPYTNQYTVSDLLQYKFHSSVSKQKDPASHDVEGLLISLAHWFPLRFNLPFLCNKCVRGYWSKPPVFVPPRAPAGTVAIAEGREDHPKA
jgi:hypothetical protein